MADFSNKGKELAMEGVAVATRYISHHLSDNTELSGHGYARKAITAAQMSVSSAGVLTGPTDFECWTASDGSAQNPDKWNLYTASTGGDAILSAPEGFSTDVAAPVNGQAVTLSITLTP